MTVTVFAWLKLNETNPKSLARYLALTEPLLEAVGAQVTQRFHTSYTPSGNAVSDIFMVVEYPSREAAVEVFSALVYDPLPGLIEATFADYSVTLVSNLSQRPRDRCSDKK